MENFIFCAVIALCVNGNNKRASYDEIYFDRFEVKHIQKIEKKIHVTEKYNNKYLQNTSIRFIDLWILLYWIS